MSFFMSQLKKKLTSSRAFCIFIAKYLVKCKGIFSALLYFYSLLFTYLNFNFKMILFEGIGLVNDSIIHSQSHLFHS